MSTRVAILATAVLVAAAWPGGSVAADTFKVRAAGSESSGWTWKPKTHHIATGDKVVWRNPTDKTHTVTAYGRGWSKSVTLSPGERTSQTFRSAGTFKYRCTVQGHSAISDGRCVGMCGKVRAH